MGSRARNCRPGDSSFPTAIWRCHQAAKSDLIARVKEISGVSLDPKVPIVGFARRMTSYKRPMLLFTDPDRVAAIASRQTLSGGDGREGSSAGFRGQGVDCTGP